MKRKLIGISTVTLVLALLLTLAPACGKEKGELKTLKIGILTPLSGPAAAWGVAQEEGAKWARDVINEAGGFKVGDDIYKIELISVDNEWTPSKGVDGATRLVYLEKVHYALHLGVVEAVLPIFHEGKVWSLDITSVEPTLTPEFPYSLQASSTAKYWVKGFYRTATELDPTVKTVALLKANDLFGQEWRVAAREAAEAYGLTVVADELYEPGTVDFYPLLTKILPKNPDLLDFSGVYPGLHPLIIKQATELGYKGKFWAPGMCPLHEMLEMVTCDMVNGRYASNEPDYTSEVLSQATRDLYQDFVRRYHPPGNIMRYVVMHGYASVMFIVQVIQEAGSVDPDEVMKVVDDPDFRFDFFGEESFISGIEAYGVRRAIGVYQAYSETHDCKVVTKAYRMVRIP